MEIKIQKKTFSIQCVWIPTPGYFQGRGYRWRYGLCRWSNNRLLMSHPNLETARLRGALAPKCGETSRSTWWITTVSFCFLERMVFDYSTCCRNMFSLRSPSEKDISRFLRRTVRRQLVEVGREIGRASSPTQSSWCPGMLCVFNSFIIFAIRQSIHLM